MATTSLWKISGSLKKVLDYAENPDKTLQSVGNHLRSNPYRCRV